jgi:4'-phosphopantetheinyl transferase
MRPVNPRRPHSSETSAGELEDDSRTGDGRLAANEVHIWRIDLTPTGNDIRQYRTLLSADEVQRADAFHFVRDRWRFTVARAALRQILGGYLNLPAQELRFCYGPKGKPDLANGQERSGIKFNLSHSSDIALLAVASGLSVGIDVERINIEFATEDIASRYFSTTEVQALRGVASGQRGEAFFACWTRKEAYIKALGEGLSVPLDTFAVAFTPEIPAAILQVEGNPAEVERWSIYDIDAGEGYKAAVVVEGKGHKLQYRKWPCA